ncbi:MAG: efflux transporter outer membrane subunit [Elusimicrobiaceae bacterium]|nr:efflux transporter outer membrane subunit [Elusimicrobiaceae bacterium]
MKFNKFLYVVFAAALLSGCMMGPNYKRPDLELPQENTADDFSVFEKHQWWTMFEDDTLNALETEALIYNKDLQQAMARVDAARASVGVAVADQLPTIGLQGGSGRAGNDYSSGQTLSTGTIVASFELDLWGKYRRLSEAARAELLSTMAAKDTVLLSLTAQVASAYFTLRMLDAQLEIANRTLETRQESVRIYTSRYNAGYITEVDLRRVEADMYSVQATAKELELNIAQTETALAVLVGRSPRAIVEETISRDGHLRDIVVLPNVPTNLPSNLLAKRPDVRSAEGQLIAANARIGAARAAYFPDISLTAAAGFASNQLNQLFRNPSGMWAFAGQVGQPIFAGGALVSQSKAAKARYEEMLASYEKTVQTAFKETLDALNSNRINREMFEIRKKQTEALRRGYELTKKQEDAGLIGTMELLDVERNLLQAEMALASARQSELLALISVAKALGGGWDERCGFGPFESLVRAEQQTTIEENQTLPETQSEPTEK